MVMCPKQKQNTNWNQVEIEILILKGRNLPRTNSTKCETQIIFAKKQQNEHTPEFTLTTSSVITSTQLQRADYFLRKDDFWSTIMFKKFGYNENRF